MRLLMKLAFINERPDDKGYWSETGDRYIVRLFRDFVFHQKDEGNRPVLDCGHVLDALSKLDKFCPHFHLSLHDPAVQSGREDGVGVFVRGRSSLCGERVRGAVGSDAGRVRGADAALCAVHVDVRTRDAIKTTKYK